MTDVKESSGNSKRNERKKRYVICSHEDVLELWKDLELCVSKITIDDETSLVDDGEFILILLL